MMYDFLYDHHIPENEFLFSSKCVIEPFAYFTQKDHMEKFIHRFSFLTKKIFGPVDQDHAQDLCDSGVEYHYRESPWYDQWNRKYDLYFRRNVFGVLQNQNWLSGGVTLNSDNLEDLYRARDWVVVQDFPHRMIVSPTWYPKLTLFCSQTDFQDSLPFLKLLIPNVHVHTHKAIINDQITRDE